MRAQMQNVEIRGCEVKTNSKGDDYLLVHFEEETGQAQDLVDKEMDRQAGYKRGMTGTLHINIDIKSKWKNVRIVGFTPDI